jgi:site-specific recombinase XerD
MRKAYRPFRNRAIAYALIETGMRRAAVAVILLENVDFKLKRITVLEKGAVTHTYKISVEGLQAISDYIEKERKQDAEHFNAPELFLAAASSQNSQGRLHPNAVNEIWNQVCASAGVTGKTPHAARHAMGRFLIQHTGNVESVQRQLGHRNATYSMQYSRITDQELEDALAKRI